MASGWAPEGAVQDQIDASVAGEVARARSRLGQGASHTHCVECEGPIPEARQRAVPGVRRCVACQEAEDAHHRAESLYNRRGSKDSQLK